jgi:CO/xanthine dehydrogenase Mo-binding subunit
MAEQQKPVTPAKPVEPPKKMEFKLLGHNYVTPDLVAKVTGQAKYAEDYRAEGMVFIKLMPSPRPHAKIRSIDTAAALAMPGVRGILTATASDGTFVLGFGASGRSQSRSCAP